MAIRCGFTDTWPFEVASLTHGHSHPLRVRSSWDRSPFVYPDFETGKLTIVPAFRHISKNLIIGNYNSQEAIDNDDGSARFRTCVYHVLAHCVFLFTLILSASV
jgi:hypothetical protein